jgi:hypothetical protein
MRLARAHCTTRRSAQGKGGLSVASGRGRRGLERRGRSGGRRRGGLDGRGGRRSGSVGCGERYRTRRTVRSSPGAPRRPLASSIFPWNVDIAEEMQLRFLSPPLPLPHPLSLSRSRAPPTRPHRARTPRRAGAHAALALRSRRPSHPALRRPAGAGLARGRPCGGRSVSPWRDGGREHARGGTRELRGDPGPDRRAIPARGAGAAGARLAGDAPRVRGARGGERRALAGPRGQPRRCRGALSPGHAPCTLPPCTACSPASLCTARGRGARSTRRESLSCALRCG